MWSVFEESKGGETKVRLRHERLGGGWGWRTEETRQREDREGKREIQIKCVVI